MSQITIIFALVIIPVMVWRINRKWFFHRFGKAALSAFSALLVYAFIVGLAICVDFKLEADLAEFDLNGDGLFSGVEVTPEQQQAMQLVVADTGRTLAPITGGIFSVIYFLGLWLLTSVIAAVSKFRKK